MPEQQKKTVWVCAYCGAMNYSNPHRCFACGKFRNYKEEKRSNGYET